MARVSRVVAHLSIEQVNQKLAESKPAWLQQRWLIIYNAMVDPRTAQEIALHTGTSVAVVSGQSICPEKQPGAYIK